ncbi:calcineurin B-like protein 4 [Tanacetum coccineum]|uniref:Calcineurin B-like protein 4 n=1 Tax=Tanacetum coccineum TaxID=301880 RepID=A0ABQ5CTW6_9ASTR
MQKTRSVTVLDKQYAVFNGTEYAALIFLNEYAVLDRKLDTPYPMEVDTSYRFIDQNSAQIRRIFLDGYGVLVVRTVIFKISSFKLQNASESWSCGEVGWIVKDYGPCYKWIFKKKRKADGTVDKYKARLVIKGFRQREGLDYFDTYSLVTRITSIRMILAIAALRNLEVHQIDVKKAFLNGDLEEEIYMNQPEGFMAPGLESKVCRLVKSLYDLRKAPKQGHQISPYHVRMWIRN